MNHRMKKLRLKSEKPSEIPVDKRYDPPLSVHKIRTVPPKRDLFDSLKPWHHRTASPIASAIHSLNDSNCK